MPAASSSSSVAKWLMLPSPDEAKLSAHGFAFASANNSSGDFAGSFGETARISGPLPIIATAAKLFTASKGASGWIAALVVNEEEIIIRVWPSAGAFATKAAPIEPVAPARFSTITGLPRASDRRLAMARANMSFEPPGGEVTMNWIGRDGNAATVPCASTGPQASAVTSSQLFRFDAGIRPHLAPDSHFLL